MAAVTRKARTTKTSRTAGLSTGAGNISSVSDWHLRVTALETAARLNQNGNDTLVLTAANKFYAFLTGAK